MGLVRLLPEKKVKQMLAGGLLRFDAPQAVRLEWQEAILWVMQHELTRADVISHFAVAADWIRSGWNPEVFKKWGGRLVVLSAENDPTQSEKDFPRYEKMFGRPVERLSLGQGGHAAALFDPDLEVALPEQAPG